MKSKKKPKSSKSIAFAKENFKEMKGGGKKAKMKGSMNEASGTEGDEDENNKKETMEASEEEDRAEGSPDEDDVDEARLHG